MPTASSSRTPFLTIRAEGALLPVNILQRVVENDHDLGELSRQRVSLASKQKGGQTIVLDLCLLETNNYGA